METESQAPGQPTTIITINALYVEHPDGTVEVLTEFMLEAMDLSSPPFDGIGNTRAYRALDPSQPMYNILGIQVDANYKGVVIQDGRKYILR